MIGLGDSFIYGVVPIAENFMRVAEDSLNAAGIPTETDEDLAAVYARIDELEVDIEATCLKLLALHQPVAATRRPGKIEQGPLAAPSLPMNRAQLAQAWPGS